MADWSMVETYCEETVTYYALSSMTVFLYDLTYLMEEILP